MKLFNILERKKERNFQIICQTFEDNNIDSEEAVERCRSSMLSNAKTYTMFVLMVGLSLAMLFQSAAAHILVGTGILLLYIWTSAVRARGLASRFIDDVLNNPTEESKTDSTNPVELVDNKLTDK